MADNSQNSNIDVGLNLSGNALGSVQQLTQRMTELRAAANGVGDMLKGINAELTATMSKTAALNALPNTKTIKNMRTQIDNMSTTPDMMAQRYYQNISRANQAQQINSLVNSKQNFTNQSAMDGVLNQYDPKLVGQALKQRLDVAQLNGNIKKAQEAQKALDLYQSTMMQLNTKLKGVATMKRLQDQATVDFLNQPVSQMSVTQNAYGRLNRGFKTAAEEKAIRQYMANPNTLKPLSDPYANIGSPASAQAALRANASKLEATQRLMGQVNLQEDSAAKAKQIKNYTEMLGKLEEEKVKLQAISNLRRANLKNTDADLQAIKRAGTERQKNLKLEETLSGGLKVNTLSADRIAQLSPDNLILREASMVKRLSQAKQAMAQADALNNTKAKKESGELVVAYQKELDLIRQRNREQNATSRNVTADRFRDLSTSESSGALLGIQGVLMRNYMLWGGIMGAITGSYAFLRDYEMALKQTQAISQATDTQTQELSNSILKVAENSRFSAIEITEAATTLAQAGFSVAEIRLTLESVTLLATATGSTLKETVDIATASLGAFQLSAENMPRIVNQITQAMNLSKLDIQKFQLAVQYAGNAASDAGLNFEELLASVSTVANAGVRSGSTLGTGFRQLLSDLIAPSAKFNGILTRLGLTAADVDVRTKGLVGSLKVLKEAGFTTADAYQAFEVRSVAFYTALSNNLTTYDSLSANLDNNTAAMDANEIQMDSLGAQTERMNNQFKALVEVAGAGVREALKDIFHVIGDLVGLLRQGFDSQMARSILQIATMTAALTAGIYLVKGMVGAVAGLVAILPTLGRTIAGVGAATALTLPHFVAIAALVSAAIVAFQHFAGSNDDLKKALERSKTSLNAFKDSTTKLNGEITETDKKIVSLESRFESLKDDPAAVALEMSNLRTRATELGITLGVDLVNSIESVRAGWEELRIALGKELVMNLDRQFEELQNLAFLQAQINSKELTTKGSPLKTKNVRSGGYDKAYDFNTLQELKPEIEFKRRSRTQSVLGSNALPSNVNNFLTGVAQANRAGGGSGESKDIRELSEWVYDSAVRVQSMSKEELEKQLPAISEASNRLMRILNRARTQYQHKSNTAKSDEERVNARAMVNSINNYAETYQKINSTVNSMTSLYKEQNMAADDRNNASASVAVQQDLQGARAKGLTSSSLGNTAHYGSAASLIDTKKFKALNSSQQNRLKDVMPIIREASAKYGVPEDFIIANMITESGLSSNKGILGVGPDGKQTSAVGLMQVTKAAATDQGFTYDQVRTDDRSNIMAGASFLAKNKANLGGTWLDAVMGYYMGPTGYTNYKNSGKESTRSKEAKAHASKIFSNMYGYQQTGGRYNVVGEIDLPQNTQDNLNDMTYMKGMLKEYQAAYAARFPADLGSLPPDERAEAKRQAAYINQLQVEISRKAEQTNNVIRAAQAEDEARRKVLFDENKVVIEQIKGEVAEAESKLREVEAYKESTPYGDYAKQLNEAIDGLQASKLKLLEAEKIAGVQTIATYNGKSLVVSPAIAELADVKLRVDSDRVRKDLELKRKKGLEEGAKAFAKGLTDQNKLFIDNVKTAISEGADEFNRAVSISEFESKVDLWAIEDDHGISAMKATRALMDDKRFKDEYSDVQRGALTEKIDKAALDAFQIATENKLLRDKAVVEERLKDVLKIIEDFEVQQVELQTELLLQANTLPEGKVRDTTIAEINKQQAKMSKELTKNNSEVVTLREKLRDIDSQMASTNANNKDTPFGLGEEVKRVTSKALTDQNTAQGYSASVQTAIGGINGAFNDLISTAMDASDNIDDFFKILTGGSKESKEAFKAFGYSIVQTIAKVIQDRLVTKFVDMMASMLFGEDGKNSIGSGLQRTFSTASGRWFGQKEQGPQEQGGNQWLQAGLQLLGGFFTGQLSSTAIASPVGGGYAGIGADSAGTYGMFDNPTQYRSEGGLLRGRGARNVDNIPVMASDLEYMLPSNVTETVGLGALEKLRKDPEGFMSEKINVGINAGGQGSKTPSNTNVYVVSPQSVPKSLNKNDIVVAIADDVSRNGQLKTLIKQVANES